MTEEKAIDRCNELIKSEHANWIGISNQNAIEIALNMLKEKDREIGKLKKHNKELLRKLRNRVKEVKKLNKYSLYKKEFKTLNEQLKNKDKIIDFMAECIELQQADNIDTTNLEGICKEKKCKKKCLTVDKECIKQYFKSKAEKE